VQLPLATNSKYIIKNSVQQSINHFISTNESCASVPTLAIFINPLNFVKSLYMQSESSYFLTIVVIHLSIYHVVFMNSNEMLIETGDYVSASRFGNK
jgi:hypothetical protein